MLNDNAFSCIRWRCIWYFHDDTAGMRWCVCANIVEVLVTGVGQLLSVSIRNDCRGPSRRPCYGHKQAQLCIQAPLTPPVSCTSTNAAGIRVPAKTGLPWTIAGSTTTPG